MSNGHQRSSPTAGVTRDAVATPALAPQVPHMRIVTDTVDEPSAAPLLEPTPAWLGRRVGKFRLIGVLGEGGIGKVFQAEDEQLGRHVALKVIATDANGGDSPRVQQFLHEARSA